MEFRITKYRISKLSENELVVSASLTYSHLVIGLTIGFCFLFFFFLWEKVDFNSIGLVEVSLTAIVISAATSLSSSIRTIINSEVFVFNNSSNTVSKNGKQLSELSELIEIRMTEHQEDRSPREYHLIIFFHNHEAIDFDKSTDLEHQRMLADCISKLSGIPFEFQSRMEQHAIEAARTIEESNQEFAKIFEKKLLGKSEPELLEIADSDSSAEYAKIAAKRLLSRMGNVSEKSDT